MKTLVLLFALIVLANGQGLRYEEKYAIDTLEIKTKLAERLLINVPPVLVYEESVTSSSGILGENRITKLVFMQATKNSYFSVSISNGLLKFASFNAPNANSNLILQYDGTNLDPSGNSTDGLNGFNLTQNGAEGFRFSVKNPAVGNFISATVYDSQQNNATFTTELIADSATFIDYYIGFGYFSEKGVVTTSINAIIVNLNITDTTLLEINEIAAVGPANEQQCAAGKVSSDGAAHYSVMHVDEVAVGEYFTLNFTAEDTNGETTTGNLYVLASNGSDTPGPHNYEYFCHTSCLIQILRANLQITTYSFAVEPVGGSFSYSLCKGKSVTK